jgi:hypothetical protein
MGLFRANVGDMYFPYIRPQEHGNRGNVKWAAVGDILGRGLAVKAATCFEFCASHLSTADLTGATHANELVPRKETMIRVDFKNGGLGSGSCGPYTLPKYMVDDKHMRYSFGIMPFNAEEMSADILVRHMAIGDA